MIAKPYLMLPIVFVLSGAAAQAQQPVMTLPSLGTTAGAPPSGTITGTGTFQMVFAASPTAPGSAIRRGCVIENLGTHEMFVTEGQSAASSTEAAAIPVFPGGGFTCVFGGVVWTGQVNITGTAADGFYAAQY